MLLLLPAVSKSFVDELVAEHCGLADSLADGLSKKSARGESPSDLWVKLVRLELDWCADNSDCLTVGHRRQACLLLDWYYSRVGNVPESWLVIYSESECYWRLARNELDWCSRHVNELSARYREYAIDLLEDFYAANPNESLPEWNVLYW